MDDRRRDALLELLDGMEHGRREALADLILWASDGRIWAPGPDPNGIGWHVEWATESDGLAVWVDDPGNRMRYGSFPIDPTNVADVAD